MTAKRYRHVRIHNIVGQEYEDASGDGIVSLASAHLDDADSEVVVRAKHTTIHSVPLAILEVRRTLRDHLGESRRRFGNSRRDPRVCQTSNQQAIAPSRGQRSDEQGSPHRTRSMTAAEINGAAFPGQQLALVF